MKSIHPVFINTEIKKAFYNVFDGGIKEFNNMSYSDMYYIIGYLIKYSDSDWLDSFLPSSNNIDPIKDRICDYLKSPSQDNEFNLLCQIKDNLIIHYSGLIESLFEYYLECYLE